MTFGKQKYPRTFLGAPGCYWSLRSVKTAFVLGVLCKKMSIQSFRRTLNLNTSVARSSYIGRREC